AAAIKALDADPGTPAAEPVPAPAPKPRSGTRSRAQRHEGTKKVPFFSTCEKIIHAKAKGLPRAPDLRASAPSRESRLKFRENGSYFPRDALDGTYEISPHDDPGLGPRRDPPLLRPARAEGSAPLRQRAGALHPDLSRRAG